MARTKKVKATVANAPPLPSFEEVAGESEPAVPTVHGLMPSLGAEEPSTASAALLALGEPPKDAYEAADWLYRAQIASAHDAIADTKISAASRRREIRQAGAAAAALFPKVEEYKVRELIKADRRQIEERESQRGGAKLEPVNPTPAHANGHAPSDAS